MNIFWVNTILDHIDTITGPPKYEGVFIPLLIKFEMFVDDNLFTFSPFHMYIWPKRVHCIHLVECGTYNHHYLRKKILQSLSHTYRHN
jgi:hypothetical protein